MFSQAPPCTDGMQTCRAYFSRCFTNRTCPRISSIFFEQTVRLPVCIGESCAGSGWKPGKNVAE